MFYRNLTLNTKSFLDKLRPNSEHTLSAKVPNSIEEVPFRSANNNNVDSVISQAIHSLGDKISGFLWPKIGGWWIGKKLFLTPKSILSYYHNPRKLILFLVTCGLFLLLLGLGLILLYNTYEDQHHYIRPLIVIGDDSNRLSISLNVFLGPVLIGASLFTIMFSIEICIRYYIIKIKNNYLSLLFEWSFKSSRISEADAGPGYWQFEQPSWSQTLDGSQTDPLRLGTFWWFEHIGWSWYKIWHYIFELSLLFRWEEAKIIGESSKNYGYLAISSSTSSGINWRIQLQY